MNADLREKLFEQIGLQQKLFSPEEAERARHVSRQRGQAVGQVLVEQGIIAPEQLRGLERAVIYRLGRDEDKAIAKIIIDSSYCDPARVEGALRKQKEFYAQTGELMRLGTLLVQNADITESQKIAAHKIHQIEQSAGGASSQRPQP